jgi:hypothetical protein
MSELLEQIKEKIQELIHRAEEAADEAEEYLEGATSIDNTKQATDHRDYVPLDDLPYGEERVRLDGSPTNLRTLAKNLQAMPIESLTLGQLSEALEGAEDEIEVVKSTIADCTPLPSESEEDDDDDFKF